MRETPTEDGLCEGAGEVVEVHEELIVLLRGLAEAEAWVEDDVMQAQLEELADALGE